MEIKRRRNIIWAIRNRNKPNCCKCYMSKLLNVGAKWLIKVTYADAKIADEIEKPIDCFANCGPIDSVSNFTPLSVPDRKAISRSLSRKTGPPTFLRLIKLYDGQLIIYWRPDDGIARCLFCFGFLLPLFSEPDFYECSPRI